jgi:hypothetical protein
MYNGCGSLGFMYPLSSTAMVSAVAQRRSDEIGVDAEISEQFDVLGFGLSANLSGGISRHTHAPSNDYHIGIGFGLG